jgi:hypothetical protein
VQWVVPILVAVAIGAVDRLHLEAQAVSVSVGAQDAAHRHDDERRPYDGPPLSLPGAVRLQLSVLAYNLGNL